MADDTDRNPTGGLRVGACQTPEILADPDAALACIEDFARQGAEHNVDLLLFPECFLQGYLVDPDHVSRHALDLGSPEFAAVLRRLKPITPTVVVGVIETERGRYFNTAAVITGGRLVGRYRKTRLMRGETVFAPGDAFPTFLLRGVRYGIKAGAHVRSATALPDGTNYSRPVRWTVSAPSGTAAIAAAETGVFESRHLPALASTCRVEAGGMCRCPQGQAR